MGVVTGAVAAIGEPVRLAGLALVGVVVLPAEDAAAVRAAWASLGEDVVVVILTARAAEVLGPVGDRLTVVMPAEVGRAAP